MIMESGILGFGIRNPSQGIIRDPANDWNPGSKLHWQESGIHHLESRIYNVEWSIQDCLGLPYMGYSCFPRCIGLFLLDEFILWGLNWKTIAIGVFYYETLTRFPLLDNIHCFPFFQINVALSLFLIVVHDDEVVKDYRRAYVVAGYKWSINDNYDLFPPWFKAYSKF